MRIVDDYQRLVMISIGGEIPTQQEVKEMAQELVNLKTPQVKLWTPLANSTK